MELGIIRRSRWNRGSVARAVAAVALAIAGGACMQSFGALRVPTLLVYAGLVVFCAGVVTVFLPPSWSGFSHRVNGLLWGLLLGAALFAGGWFWPVRTIRVPTPTSRLDAFMPTYDFCERHELMIQAPSERVRAALNRISFADIGVVQTLGRIRDIAMGHIRTPRAGGAPPSMPLLEMMNDPRSGFFPLEDAREEYVFGLAGKPWANVGVRLTRGQFREWNQPESVKIAVNFLIRDLHNGRSLAITETRVFANDDAARRKMAKYWTLIYPGTGMIRRGLLQAIRVRAEEP